MTLFPNPLKSWLAPDELNIQLKFDIQDWYSYKYGLSISQHPLHANLTPPCFCEFALDFISKDWYITAH